MKRALNRACQFPFWLAALAVIPSASPAAETVLLEQPQLAGISGFREFWDTPVVLADGGLVVETVHTPGGTGPTAVWSPAKRDGGAKPGAIAFDAVHRSLLVRFPGAAEKIAAKLGAGLAVQKAELILPFRAAELWPEGYLEPAGMSFLGDAWAKDSPRWHAVAYALRKPWFADAQRGPTFNAAVNGQLFWAKYGAQDLRQDRYERQFGPAEVSAANAVGRLDVTAALNDPAFGATAAERLRQFEDCGFVVRKWEVYDARLWQGGYEWATATGPRGILIGSPKLEVTMTPIATREKSACRLPTAPELSKLSGGTPTAVLPSAEQIGKLAARLKFQRPQGMPDWQWQRVQEVHQLGGAAQFPATLEAYHQWLDEQLGYAPRRWSGFDATERAQDYFKYYDALPEPVRDHWKLYWWAWLMPDRSFPEFERDGKKYQFAQGYIGGKEAQAYYAQTGDWRGNFSVYRTYCWTMGTMNFNHWAVAGTLLGGQIMDSEQCLADGRQGLEQWPLRTWCWFDGSTQESIDHYYFAHSLTAQKVFADFGPAPLDRMMGQSIMAKSLEELTSSYHPGLRRFISSSGRTGIGYVLGIQDGLQHILHTLSREGAYTDFGQESVTAPNVEKLSAIGHDYRPGQAAEQSLNGPWAPEWMAQMVDAKPLPFESTVTYKMWGGYSQTPLLKRSYLGRHYGLASLDVSVDNETVPVMAQWRRTDKKAASLTDLGTLLIRPGLNRTELLDSIYHDTQQRNPNGSVGTQGSHLVTLQHKNKAVVLTSPFPKLQYSGGRPVPDKITSVQTTVGLFNFADKPDWELYVDGQRVTRLPCKAKFGQRITIKDGLSYIGLIPIPPSKFPRTDEVVLADDGEMTEMQGGGKVREALRINAYLVKSDTLLDTGTIDRLDLAYAGYVIEVADATEYPSFVAFQEHLRDADLDLQWDDQAQMLAVVYKSGSDTLECGYQPGYGGDWDRRVPTDQCFPYRRVNGVWPYLADGVERDTTLSQISRTGRLEKNGATLVTQRGTMAYLLTEPVTGSYIAMNPFPEPAGFALTLPRPAGAGQAGSVSVKTDGRLGLVRIIVQPQQNRLTVDHAVQSGEDSADLATALFVFGLPSAPGVLLNGQPLTKIERVTLDGQTAYVIPLAAQPATDLSERYRHAQELLAKEVTTLP